jgi:hypothetical protein
MDNTDTFVSFTGNFSGMHNFFSRPSWGSRLNRIHIVQNTQSMEQGKEAQGDFDQAH